MRALIFSILISAVSSFTFLVNAQVTAVMQAKVEIISGAGFLAMEAANIDLSTVNYSEDIETGSFSLVAAPGADVNVHISNQSSIKNKEGGIIEFEPLKINHITSESGEHHISVNGKIKDHQKLNGHYEGDITAVVEYL
ncbi:MAG: hypothetical protein HUJ22_10405 [Gracilimonas sp.]|uniref:hypothetical protein n=1 Tax=Gracilimonas sp. TaxID=1974203 RepID=UPI00199EC68B|nr:hypothetical protein [Gracilimonas sp.]MBD3616971.1 hypothetical protein [Gracilimonas sp.]